MVWIVTSKENRDLELNVHAKPVQHETQENRSSIEIENMLHAEVGVVIQELVQPLQGMLIRLTNAAKVAVMVSGPPRCGLDPSVPLVSSVSTKDDP